LTSSAGGGPMVFIIDDLKCRQNYDDPCLLLEFVKRDDREQGRA